ncbi:MAG: zinc ABC transporter permease [Sulfuricurvum sp. PC08-66]|nr:MAG: zinc ABC transporter permease [Sulfuricurvum sp. PC08-66]
MLEMFTYDFMVNAFWAGMIIAVVAATAGSFMVLRRYAMMSDTLAHVALVGVAVGIVAHQSTLWMAVIVSVLAAWLIEYLRYVQKIYSDATMALFLSGSLALAVIIVSLAGSFNSTLFSYLFGNILTVSKDDIITITVVGAVAMGAIVLHFEKLFFVAFDEEVAKTSGIAVGRLNFLLITIVALVVALSLRIVGSLLIGAMMVIPALTAMQYRQSFVRTVLLANLFALLSVLLGLSASYIWAIPSGASIVAAALLFFLLSLLRR